MYLIIERIDANTLYERYIEDGVEKSREVAYKPSFFSHTTENTKYKDIFGKSCKKYTFSSMYEANQWKRKMEESNLVPLGMDDFILSYIGDTYNYDIEYDRSKIRIAVVDIEVTGDEFPNPDLAIYPIDAITHYDSIDDKYYVFDLIDRMGSIVKPWNKERSMLRSETLDKVVYMAFNTELELLNQYVNLMRAKPPVGYSGWNCDGFDIKYIVNRLKIILPERVNELSPVGVVSSATKQSAYGQETIYNIVGINILDYMDLYKKYSFTNLPSYNLETASRFDNLEGKVQYTGPINKLRDGDYIPPYTLTERSVRENKDILSYAALLKNVLHTKLNNYYNNVGKQFNKLKVLNLAIYEKLDLYKTYKELLDKTINVTVDENNLAQYEELYAIVSDWHSEVSHQRYIDYNIGDVEVILDIEKKRQFFELVISLAYYSKINYSHVKSPLKTWDAIIYNSLKEENLVIPYKRNHVKERYPGAFVKEPKVGAYRHVVSFDLTSLNVWIGAMV